MAGAGWWGSLHCPVPFSLRQLPLPSLWHVTAFLVTVLATGWTMGTFEPEIRRLLALEAQADALSAEERRLEGRLDEIRRRQQWLENDPAYVEAVARDRLDLQRTGETIFRIPRSSISQ